MTDEARAAKRLYQKEWRRRNPDRVQEYNARYWQGQAQKMGVDPKKPQETAKRMEGSTA